MRRKFTRVSCSHRQSSHSRSCLLFAQDPAPAAQAPVPAYQPKFPGDPARSDSEAAALAYMRVVLRAQHQFKSSTAISPHPSPNSSTPDPSPNAWSIPIAATTPPAFKGKKDSFILTMTPNHLDAQHRSFYAEDDGKIHADEEKPADARFARREVRLSVLSS